MISYIEKRLGDAHARLKRGVPLAANQVNYSLIYRTPELNGVKAACDELGITLIAYSPIAQGRNQSLNFLYPIIR
jgi:aryl-alcohol dehydrogenase-like predicted oxidoreductase